MSFAGDLEHLPIVDVIQLLHSTKKTGTLYLNSHKGESQLVFIEGYIVSANHVQNSIRIGQILMEKNIISSDQLDQALHSQTNAGANRKPLIATLIENGHIKKDDAYSGLQTLIELTIVEILTWNSGTFALDINATDVSDEYRYFPETLKQEINLNTQSILMDALRIFDERMRDGSLQKGAFTTNNTESETLAKDTITADDLGLDDLDSLEKKIPDMFMGLKVYDASEIHRQKIRESMINLSPQDQDRLLSALMELSDKADTDNQPHDIHSLPLATIVFSQNEFIKHIIATVCKHERIFFLSTDDENDLDVIIDQSFSKELIPLLVLDAPVDTQSAADHMFNLLQQKLLKYPTIPIIQLTEQQDCQFPLKAIQAGVKNILTKPVFNSDAELSISSTLKFIRAFHIYLQKSFTSSEQRISLLFKDSIHELDNLQKIQDIAFILLKFASNMFERSITFVVRNNELIAEKSFGINANRDEGVSPPLLFTIPIAQASVFRDVVNNGHYFYGQCNDTVLREQLYLKISAPHTPKIILMPIKSLGKVIAVIYADFGKSSGSPLQIELLEILSKYAGLVHDNNILKRKLISAN